MQAGVTGHMWDLGEFMEAILSAGTCDAPTAKPLRIPVPATTSRPIPGGFLRVVPGSGGPSAPVPPAPTPPVAPAAPVPATGQAGGSAPVAPPPVGPRQLDLFAARPTKPLPPRGSQLSLFDD
jgi:hypothetical protein